MSLVRVVESFEEEVKLLETFCEFRSTNLTERDLQQLAKELCGLESRLETVEKELQADNLALDARLELAYRQRAVLEARLSSTKPSTALLPTTKANDRKAAASPDSSPSADERIRAIHAQTRDHAPTTSGLVADDEFQSISAYMRGRLTLEKVNNAFVELKKHAETNRQLVLAVRKSQKSPFDRKHALWLSHNIVPAIKHTGSKLFVVDTDLKQGNHLQMGSNSSRAILTILRHLGRTMETRVSVDGKSHIIYSLLSV